MIYTVTLNPSLDYVVTVPTLQFGAVNRSVEEELVEGGKGINVSIVLQHLGIESKVLGFLAGYIGDAIEQGVQRHGCTTEFIRVANGMSRINVKMKSQLETEVNGQGPIVTQGEVEQLMLQLEQLGSGDYLVLAGSVPKSIPTDIYEQMMIRLQDKKVKVVVDTTKDLLRNVLSHQPFLVKPNHHELGELFNVTIKTKEDAGKYARKLQQMGARNVLVSMAKQGAVFLSETGECYQKDTLQQPVMNSVGAGDSMVAGFLYGYEREKNYEKALLYAVAAGSASAFSRRLAKKNEIEEVYQKISCLC